MLNTATSTEINKKGLYSIPIMGIQHMDQLADGGSLYLLVTPSGGELDGDV